MVGGGMATAYDNYPMGTGPMDPYFYWEDPPGWPECTEVPNRMEYLCPSCDYRRECPKWEEE